MASNHGAAGSHNQDNTHSSPNIGHHLNRLHRRAQQQQIMQNGATPTPTPNMMDMGGRASSVMSDMTAPTPTNPPMPPMGSHMQPQGSAQGQGGVRRASDPVRTLDRNFGVDGNISRHNRSGSYNQLNMMGQQQQRVPLHGQRIRGTSGDTFFHQQQPMVRTLDFISFIMQWSKHFTSFCLLIQLKSKPFTYHLLDHHR